MPLVGDGMLRAIDVLVPRDGLVTRRVRTGSLAGLVVDMYPHALDMAIGRYEPLVSAAIRQSLSEGDVAFDVGANAGYFTLLMGRCVGKRGRIVAFEPDPWVRNSLCRNVARNRATIEAPIEVAAMAIGQNSERGSFVPGSRSTWGRLGSRSDALPIDVMTLDDAVKRYGVPRLIKIDVEGGEYDVLEGGRKSLSTLASTIVIEAHSTELERRCIELLDRCGFACDRLVEPGRKQSYIVATRPRAER